jgi:hypothetical protein
MDNTNVSELAGRARRLKTLAETVGWQELCDVFEERRNNWALTAGNDLLRKNSTINQRDIDWRAGFIAGCEWLLANPDAVEGNLERVLRRADRNG